MKTLEIEGKTIDDAIEKACKEFNVPREKLNLEIISEGSSGFLGLVGSQKARIKARIISINMDSEKLDEAVDDTPLTTGEYHNTPPLLDVPAHLSAVGVYHNTPALLDVPAHLSAVGVYHNTPALLKDEPDETVTTKAKRILEGILTRMNLDFPVTVEETSEAITLNIKGTGNGLLIGKRGQTLDAIQYIINMAVKKYERSGKKIIIDTEDYRKRRTESLTALAEKLGQKVKTTNKPVTVSNLNAHDRRIIHLALQNDKFLITKSRGEGTYRKIIILPTGKE